MTEEVQVTGTAKIEVVAHYLFRRQRSLDLPDWFKWNQVSGSGFAPTYENGQPLPPTEEASILCRAPASPQDLAKLKDTLAEHGWKYVSGSIVRRRESVTIPADEVVQEVL